MYLKKLFSYILFQTLMVASLACMAIAEVNLTLAPAGGNIFILKGSGLNGIAVADLEFTFDTAIMDKPKAARGELIDSGAFFDFKQGAPGEMRLFIRDSKKLINGSGTLATFTFETIGNAEGDLVPVRFNLVKGSTSNSVVARIQILGRPPKQSPTQENTPGSVSAAPDSARDPVPANAPADQAATTTPADTAVQSGATGAAENRKSDSLAQSGSNRTESRSTQLSSTLGRVVFPAGQSEEAPVSAAAPSPETQPTVRPAPAQAHQRPVPEDTVPAAPTATLKSATYQSIPDKFREYGGARTVKALAELFLPGPGQLVRQEPAVALSDGVKHVLLRVELPPNLKETPSFSLRKASLVSIVQNDDGSWLVTARPSRDTLEARLTVSSGGNEILFPLVTAPPLKAGKNPDGVSIEESFTAYLKLKGTGKEPRPDLNGDGKNDYLDDYIFAANYLASRHDSGPQAGGEK